MYISFAWSYKFPYSFLHYAETIVHGLKSFTNLRKLKKPQKQNAKPDWQLSTITFNFLKEII